MQRHGKQKYIITCFHSLSYEKGSSTRLVFNKRTSNQEGTQFFTTKEKEEGPQFFATKNEEGTQPQIDNQISKKQTKAA